MMRAWILNCNFPVAFSDVEDRIAAGGRAWCIDELAVDCADGDILGAWTAPKWASAGDVCFIMCAKSAPGKAKRMLAESNRGSYPMLSETARRAVELSIEVASRLAGQVFAYACVTSPATFVIEGAGGSAWSNRNYAELGALHTVASPVDVLAEDSPVSISRFGGVTEVKGDALAWMCAMCDIDMDSNG